MWLSVDEFGDVYVSGKSKPSIMDLDLKYYRIWKRYYVKKSSPDLRKINQLNCVVALRNI